MMESKIKQKLNYIKNKFETIIDFRKKWFFILNFNVDVLYVKNYWIFNL
jgi:hypothetical protein